jgi:hypothetical protein
MRHLFFRKISDWRGRPPDRPKKGSIFMTTVFVLLAFTTLGLGMAVLSQVYLKVAGLKKNSYQLEYASENGIKAAFHHLREAIGGFSGPLILTDLRALDLSDSVRNGEARILEEELGLRFPVIIEEAAGDVTWRSQAACRLELMVEGSEYLAAQYILPIESRGTMSFLPVNRKSELDVRIGAAVGRLPLLLFPFLIDSNLEAGQKEAFAVDHGISLMTSPRNLLAGALSSSAEPLIPRDATPLLEKGLKTRLFRPQDLTNAKLRFALGLEESDTPVPDGVYLVQDSLGLGGIYVVGDVEEMVLAIEGSYQVISFQMAAGDWTLKFSPQENSTRFFTPEGDTAFDQVPLGIIMASGSIDSLGGGALDAAGEAVLVQDREVPSLLRGVELTVVASDRIDISSHLIAQGLEWRDGIPYVKEEQTQLVIYSAGQEFQEAVGTGGGITIADTAPPDLKIQASLTAQGLGFEIAGAGRTVSLLGSLQAVDYASGGNQLDLYAYLSAGDIRKDFFAVPQTALPVLAFPLFETLDWRE